jgi:hypothetical protein
VINWGCGWGKKKGDGMGKGKRKSAGTWFVKTWHIHTHYMPRPTTVGRRQRKICLLFHGVSRQLIFLQDIFLCSLSNLVCVSFLNEFQAQQVYSLALQDEMYLMIVWRTEWRNDKINLCFNILFELWRSVFSRFHVFKVSIFQCFQCFNVFNASMFSMSQCF